MTKYTTVILAVFAAVLLTACDQLGQSTTTNSACDEACVRRLITEAGESKGGEDPGDTASVTEEEPVERTPESYGRLTHTEDRPALQTGDVELTEISGAILRRNDRECLVWTPTGTEPSAAAALRLAKCGDWRARS